MNEEEVIARGAEAVIIKQKNTVIKNRIEKTYRHPILDEKLRKFRTRAEAKLLEKAYAIIPVPKIMNRNKILPNKPYEITIEFIKGKKLADNLEKLNYKKICTQIGNSLAKLHDAGIIHGDLTTSNMIYVKENKIKNKNKKHQSENYQINNNQSVNERARGVHEKITDSNSKLSDNSKKGKVYFIDFGLGFHSQKTEDKAVDLHLIKQALEAKHPSIFEQAYKSILQGYKISKNYQATVKQLEAVEKRGRYKAQY